MVVARVLFPRTTPLSFPSLQTCIEEGHSITEIKQGFEQERFNVHQKEKGTFALHLVLRQPSPNFELVQFLLDRGADIECEDEKGETALGIALTRGQPDLVNLLLNPVIPVQSLPKVDLLQIDLQRKVAQIREDFQLCLNKMQQGTFDPFMECCLNRLVRTLPEDSDGLKPLADKLIELFQGPSLEVYLEKRKKEFGEKPSAESKEHMQRLARIIRKVQEVHFYCCTSFPQTILELVQDVEILTKIEETSKPLPASEDLEEEEHFYSFSSDGLDVVLNPSFQAQEIPLCLKPVFSEELALASDNHQMPGDLAEYLTGKKQKLTYKVDLSLYGIKSIRDLKAIGMTPDLLSFNERITRGFSAGQCKEEWIGIYRFLSDYKDHFIQEMKDLGVKEESLSEVGEHLSDFCYDLKRGGFHPNREQTRQLTERFQSLLEETSYFRLDLFLECNTKSVIQDLLSCYQLNDLDSLREVLRCEVEAMYQLEQFLHKRRRIEPATPTFENFEILASGLAGEWKKFMCEKEQK